MHSRPLLFSSRFYKNTPLKEDHSVNSVVCIQSTCCQSFSSCTRLHRYPTTLIWVHSAHTWAKAFSHQLLVSTMWVKTAAPTPHQPADELWNSCRHIMASNMASFLPTEKVGIYWSNALSTHHSSNLFTTKQHAWEDKRVPFYCSLPSPLSSSSEYVIGAQTHIAPLQNCQPSLPVYISLITPNTRELKMPATITHKHCIEPKHSWPCPQHKSRN